MRIAGVEGDEKRRLLIMMMMIQMDQDSHTPVAGLAQKHLLYFQF